MNPIELAPEPDKRYIEFAKDQPQYRTLPALVGNDGTVITQWEFTEEELHKIFIGGHLRLILLYAIGGSNCPNCGIINYRSLNPIKLEIVEPECGFGEKT